MARRRRRRIRNTRSTDGHPLILYNLYAREPRAFSDISKETRPTRFPLSPHTSRTVSAVVPCVYLLKPASALYSPDEFISRTRSVLSPSPISLISCSLPRVMAYNARRLHATNKRARSRKSFKETRSECSSCRRSFMRKN